MKDDIKIADDLSEVRKYCKCGHVVYLLNKYDFSYCGYCGRRVYKNDEIEFKRKIIEKINGVNSDQRRLDLQ